jgi:hypothetical protein
MNTLSIKKTLVLFNTACIFLITFLNRIIDLAFEDRFTEAYEVVKKIESSMNPVANGFDIIYVPLVIGFLCYFVGLYFAFKEKPNAKVLLSIGALAMIFSQMYDATTSLIYLDYAPAVAIRYLWFFLTGSLLVILHLEEFGHIKELSDD